MKYLCFDEIPNITEMCICVLVAICTKLEFLGVDEVQFGDDCMGLVLKVAKNLNTLNVEYNGGNENFEKDLKRLHTNRDYD
jgi:hypothetical protein